jgi:hypothetical protein
VGVAVSVGVGVGMWVGVAVGVLVSVGVGVLVGVGVAVLVGGMGVLVGVLLGGTEAAVGGIGVGACVKTSGVAVGPQAVASSVITTIPGSKGSLFIISSFSFINECTLGYRCQQMEISNPFSSPLPFRGACVIKRLSRNRAQREVNAGRIVRSIDRHFCG